MDHFWKENVADRNLPLTRRQNAIESWIWASLSWTLDYPMVLIYEFQISKALAVRNHQLASNFMFRVFEVFSDDTVNWSAAKAIGDIAAADPILTKRHHAVIKVMALTVDILLVVNTA